MAFCRNCGATVEGRFCAKCGAAVAAGEAPPQAPHQPAQSRQAAAGLEDNLAAALAYIVPFIGPVIFLSLAPYNAKKRIRFHAFQALFLDIAFVGVWIAYSVLASVLISIVPGLWGLWTLVGTLLWIGFLVVAVYAVVKTYQNEELVLPVIGPLARQQA